MEHGPAIKRTRYSLEPDVEIVIQEETIPVHSLLWMMASPVFEAMLQSGMQESSEGRIVLHGKSPNEFRELKRHIEVFGGTLPPPIDHGNLNLLLRWADEYQISGLLDRCETFLLRQKADDVKALKLAVEFKLSLRTEQCIKAISADIMHHVKKVGTLLEHDETMGQLWPSIYQKANIPVPTVPPTTLEDVWPLIVAGLHAIHSLKTMTFASAEEAKTFVAERSPLDRWVLCLGEEQIKRLCRKRSSRPDVHTHVHVSDKVLAIAGKTVWVDSVTDNGNLIVRSDSSTPDEIVKMPYDTVLRPL